MNRRKRSNVLAVDDNAANLIALDAVLDAEHNVIRAESGAQALAILAERQDIDVIIMDVQMPGMDGFEAATRIKAMEHCKDIPIVFVTAVFNEDPFVKRGYQAGGIDYFSKPFDPEILKLKVGIYASFRQREQLLRERELRVAESEELVRAGRKLTSVLESLPVGILIADLDGRICQTTQEVERIWEFVGSGERDAYGEMLGWWDENGRTIKDQNGSLGRALHGGLSTPSAPVQIRCIDGSVKTVYTSTSPLRGLDGRVVGAVIFIQDITEPRRIGEEIEERVARLIGIGVELEHVAEPRRAAPGAHPAP